jgi:hypothetical protein
MQIKFKIKRIRIPYHILLSVLGKFIICKRRPGLRNRTQRELVGLLDAGAAMPKIAAHGIALQETELATTIIEK